jgi:hypothetical protein
MWNGTADTLKRKPTASSPTPASSRVPSLVGSAEALAMPSRLVVPVAP